MHKLPLIALSLICVLALSGCASAGKAAKPAVCPRLPDPPASLMQPPQTGQKVRGELFEPPTKPTHK